MKWLLCFIFCRILSAGQNFEGCVGKPLDLLSLFLPENPTIFAAPGYEEELARCWPAARLNTSTPADLFRVHLDTMDNWESLSSAKAIYIDRIPHERTPKYIALKAALKKFGLFPLARWMEEGTQMSAIFVRKDFYYNLDTARYLQTHAVSLTNYGIYDSIYFDPSLGRICFYVDDADDSVKQTLKTGHAYEGNLSLLIYDLLKPATIAIDIGAHIGVHTLFMSRKIGPHGAIIAFEPNQKLYMELLANMELGDCKNVIAICKGLGDAPKTVYQRNIEIEQMDPIKGEGHYIDVVPLDAYHFNNVSLIKMDVENYEYFVFQGARETILRNKPLILFECWIGCHYDVRNPERQRANFERVMALIESYGYEIYIIYNCDFLAIPIGSPLLDTYKQQFQKLNSKTYQGAL